MLFRFGFCSVDGGVVVGVDCVVSFVGGGVVVVLGWFGCWCVNVNYLRRMVVFILMLIVSNVVVFF